MTTIAELTAEARAFLDATCVPRSESEATFVWGEGSDRVNILEEVDPAESSAQLADAKRYAAARYDAGLGWIDGPVEYGGRGLTLEHARAFQELEANYELPNLSMLTIAIGFIGPALLVHASPEVRAEYLPKLYRGDLVMCQLFSEPNAGSDLAAAATRAVRDGDEWVVNGQKVWTSSAHVADLALAVCRTDPDVPKHRGLTTFLVDMHSPGVEVRPLRQMTGTAGFNEVFLSDVRVPDSHRIGELNAGFGVILTTLGNERTIATRSTSSGAGIGQFERLLGVVDTFGDRADPHQRQRLAQLYIGGRVKQLLIERWRAVVAPGRDPGAGDVGPQAALVPAQQRAGGDAHRGARPAARGGRGGVGLVLVDRVRALDPRRPDRRGHRGDRAQHGGREGPRPPEGTEAVDA